MILGLAAALTAAGLYGVAAVLQANSARRVAVSPGLDPRVMLRILRQPTTVVALVLMAAGFLLHLVAIRLVPLFLAQAGIAVSLVVTALLAVVWFGERLSRLEWTAVLAVFSGLVLLSASAGRVGSGAGQGLPAVLLAALGVIAALAWTAGRSHRPVSTVALGLLAGFGYAIVGISARLLPGLGLDELVGSASSYSLALAGSLAFFLYSLALQRGGVTLVTTPMIVAQTVTPALVGVWLLGDGVRPGWQAAAAVGFGVTVIAATALVRFEAR